MMENTAKMPKKKIVIISLVLLFFALLLSLHHIMSDMGVNRAERISNQTIEYVKLKLETYDNYIANDETKSLVRLLDKLTVFADILKNEPVSEEEINHYAKSQRIQGIIVLDYDMNTVLQTTKDGDTFNIWKSVLQSDSVKQIIECPKKSYMIRTKTESGTYDVAVTARTDNSGVILGYVLQDTVKEGVNDITLDNIFEGMIVDNDGYLAISKENTLLASNKEIDKNFTPEDWEKICKESIPVRSDLGKIEYNGQRWYVREAKYQDYVIHITLAVSEIFQPYYFATAVIMLLYCMICCLIAALLFKLEKRSMDKLKKYYDIISAESEVYIGTLLVDLNSGESEWIKIPDEVRRKVGKESGIDKIVKNIADVYVKEAYKEEYLAFTDMGTIRERMQGKRIVSFTYEDKLDNWITVGIVPQHTDEKGKIDSVLYLISNVTEEMKKEKEYQKQLKIAGDVKINFLRRMSHDIRTPINGMKGIIEIAQKNPDDRQIQKKCLEKVKTASGYLLDLVNNVLDMSKLEFGEVKLEHKSFHLLELLRKANEVIKMQCEECGLTFHIEEYEVKHERLIGSPVHLQRILMNFASNAVKYNRKGGGIFVSAREISATDEVAEFEFVCRDTGIGMSEEYQKHIFEPFTQERNSSRTNYAGTGLGMPIAKELVELQGGTIEMKSELNVGTAFKIRIPFEIDQSAEETEVFSPEELDMALEGLHILLVEDNELNMEVAEYLLEESGAVITKAWNGKEALDIFAESKPGTFDAILMDIMMPVMGGWEATRQIRRLERSDAADIPIIAMSANAFTDDIAHSAEVGMNAHIVKPLDMNVVFETIVKLVRK